MNWGLLEDLHLSAAPVTVPVFAVLAGAVLSEFAGVQSLIVSGHVGPHRLDRQDKEKAMIQGEKTSIDLEVSRKKRVAHVLGKHPHFFGAVAGVSWCQLH